MVSEPPRLSRTSAPLLKNFPANLDLALLDPSLMSKLTWWEMANRKLEEWDEVDMGPYIPSPEQWAAHLSPQRFRLLAGGEGSGKSRFAAQELFGRIQPGGRYWFAGKQYENTHVEFRYLVRLLLAIGAIDNPKEDIRDPVKEAWQVKCSGPFAGAEVWTRSVDDFTKIASWALSGAVMCEAALCSEEAFKRMVGRVRRTAGWLLLAGTFEKTEGPWYASLYNAWQVPAGRGSSFSMPSWSNLVSYPGGMDDPEIQAFMEDEDEDRFMERYAGRPVKPSTLVFKKFAPAVHVGSYPFRKFLAKDDAGRINRDWVELAADPGYANYAILAIQRDKRADGMEIVRVIDEVWGHNKTTEELIGECRLRPWWENIRQGYAGVMDVASKQHHGDRSVREVWRTEANFSFRMRHVKVEDGIDRLASFLEDMSLKAKKGQDGELLWTKPEEWSRLFIDKRCKNLVQEFTEYRYGEGPITERRVPIDAYNHGVKALSYWLVDRFGFSRRKKRRGVDFKFVK